MRIVSSISSVLGLVALVGCGDKPADTGPVGGGSVDPDLLDEDGDGFLAAEDCDDADASAYPGAEEVCDGVDNDCDDEVDEGAIDASTWYADDDGDGEGDAGTAVAACEAPAGHVADASDCDDTDPAISSFADEVCDGADNDCDGDVDEPDAIDAPVWYGDSDADGYGDPDRREVACVQPVGFVADASDCNDQAATAFPGAAEVCDGLDNDCNGETDEDASADAVTWYADADGDGYGDAALGVVQCGQPSGHVLDATDCDDGASTSNPGAPEYCDGVDNDCDGATDEDDAVDTSTWFYDGDADGYGRASISTQSCAAPSGFVADDTDCDDSMAAVNPGATEVCNGIDDDCDSAADDADGSLDTTTASSWYTDGDGDGYGLPASVVLQCEAPSGTIETGGDCDDASADVNPGASEICNGIDDDCDSAVDDADGSVDVTTGETFHADGDGDGFGDAGATVEACEAPSGYVLDATDCDDGASAVNPSATEICDTVDNDCDGDVDDADTSLDGTTGSEFYTDADGDGYGDAAAPVYACLLPAGAVADATDCDDTRATSFPGADEYCNTRDDDCDGSIDEDDALDALTWYADDDGDGFGDAGVTTPACNEPSDYVADATDCDDGNWDIFPGADEVCNGVDDDCNSLTDDADPGVDTSTGDAFYLDFDGDGYGLLTASVDACTVPSGYVDDSSDCDDIDADVYPGADEVCDGVDNDCDGAADESSALDVSTWYADSDGDGYGNSVATVDACTAPAGYVADATDCNDVEAGISPGATEIWYDGIDSDCGADSDYDADADGYLSDAYTGTDCDDNDASISPAATEVWYDGVDQDCDAANDYDADADGYESDAHSGDDCDDTDAAVFPGGTDVWYDGVDSDCDGASDYDADADGFDSSSYGGGDCADDDHTVHPYAYEASDGVDNDCDGSTDEAPGTALSLGDDALSEQSFGFGFPFCGTTYSSVSVGSNGILYFENASTDFSETEAEFVDRGAAIAAFWDDLNPSAGGTVYVEAYSSAFAVFWDGVPEWGTSTSNTFTTVFFDDGTILQTFDGMSATDGLVGWSCATGVAGDVDLTDELDARVGGDLYIGDGSEDAFYELFSSANPLDLDGEVLWYLGSP